VARILIQTDDRRTLLDEGDIEVADLHDAPLRSALFERIGRALQDAGGPPASRRPAARRVAVILPAVDYREVGA